MRSAAAMVGTMVGNYRLLGLLGEGAMGAVFLAENPEIHRRVAIKILQPSLAQTPYFAGRFVAEARAASAVRHAHIVDILDFGRLPDGSPYIVMEHLEGETLAQRLARAGRLPVPVAIEYARQVASALEYAHARGIVHRDLKPANLFVAVDARPRGREPRGSEPFETIKVLDFGVAKLQSDFSAVQTRTGAVVGTPAYLSPEQCRGNRDVDHRADVYALGAVLYEMLCGTPPFQSDGLGDMMDQHMNVVPERPGNRRPGIPPAVEAAVMRALAKRPEDRFARMADFEAALDGRPPPRAMTAETLEASLPGAAAERPAARGLDSDLAGTLAPPAGGAAPVAARSRFGRLAIAGAVAAAGAVALFVATRAGVRPPGPAPASLPRIPSVSASASAIPEAARPLPAPTPTPTPTGSTEAAPVPSVTVTLRSVPAGAQVFDRSTGALRGITPLVLTLQRGVPSLALQLRKGGYRVQEVSIPADADAVIQVQMTHKARSRAAAPSTAGLDSL